MTFKVDLKDVEAWSAGDILPPGTHNIEVFDAKEGSAGTGTPQLELELRAIDGEFDGGQIRDWIAVTPKTAGKVKQLLEALGIDGTDAQVSFEAADLVGKKARIIVRNELYDGKERTKVKGYEPLGEPAKAAAGAKSDDTDLPF